MPFHKRPRSKIGYLTGMDNNLALEIVVTAGQRPNLNETSIRHSMSAAAGEELGARPL